jgi:hypothetical protein
MPKGCFQAFEHLENGPGVDIDPFGYSEFKET